MVRGEFLVGFGVGIFVLSDELGLLDFGIGSESGFENVFEEGLGLFGLDSVDRGIRRIFKELVLNVLKVMFI